MPKLVYDFTEGNKDLKDLLGGKGANLAEMTNLGLPVPPGFIITTEACRYYLEQGAVPDGLARRGHRAPRRARAEDGPQARRPRRPAAGQRAVRGQVLHARHDGDRAQHRPVRRVGARPGQAGRQRAVRLGLLPAADPDVRQDRAGHRGRTSSSTPSTPPSRPRAPRTTWTWTPRTCRRWSRRFKAIVKEQDRPGLPAGPARADGPGGPGGLRLLERRPGHPLPAPGADPGRPRHRGQHRARWCSATSAWTPAPASPSPATPAAASRASTATTCRTRRARTSSRASATRCRCRTWSRSTPSPTPS